MSNDETKQFFFERPKFYWLRNRLYKQFNLPVDDLGGSDNSDGILGPTKAADIKIVERVTGRKVEWQKPVEGE